RRLHRRLAAAARSLVAPPASPRARAPPGAPRSPETRTASAPAPAATPERRHRPGRCSPRVPRTTCSGRLRRIAQADTQLVVAQAQHGALAHCERMRRLDTLLADIRSIGAVEVIHKPARLDPAQLRVIARDALIGDAQIVVDRATEADQPHLGLELKTQLTS